MVGDNARSALTHYKPTAQPGTAPIPARRGAAPRRGPVRSGLTGRGGEGSAPAAAGTLITPVSRSYHWNGVLAKQIKDRIWARADPYDRYFLASIFGRIPAHIASRLLKEWEAHIDQEGRYAGNRYALSLRDELIPELFPKNGLTIDASDDFIVDTARKACCHFRAHLHAGMSNAGVEALLAATANCYGIRLPTVASLEGKVSRMLNEAWWRRAIRRLYAKVEHAAIKAGCVHRRAAPYVTDDALRRHRKHAEKTTRLLQRLEAVNGTTGQVRSLSDLRDGSLANPTFRRIGMMVCIKGLEQRANNLNFAAIMVTVTCPSRMHPRLSMSGAKNPTYDGTSPEVAQKYLARNVWSRATSYLKNAGVRPSVDYFGVRVVEPHHDATPHWHILVFVAREKLTTFISAIRDYSLRDSPTEPGASLHRFTVKHVDPDKGSAIGYIAKYIAKSIDGKSVETDKESGCDGASAAERIVVWARQWGIRQFQFFGVGVLTPFRELYRVDRLPDAAAGLIQDLWSASKTGNFGDYLAARENKAVKLRLTYESAESSRYPGEEVKRIRGVSAEASGQAAYVTTRPDTWTVRLRSTKPLLPLDSIQ